MPDIVAGVGRQPSVRNIVPVALANVVPIEGEPLRVIGRSVGIEFEAGRAAVDKDFTRFTLRLDGEFPHVADALEAANEMSESCEVREEDGTQVFVCPPASSEDAAAGLNAVDQICAKLSLPEVWRFSGQDFESTPLSIELLFRAMVQYEASDLHLTPGNKPIFRVENQARTAEIMGPVSARQILDLIESIAPEGALREFKEKNQCSFGFHQVGLGFARTTAFVKMGAPHLTFRYLSEEVGSFEELGIPVEMLQQLATVNDGLLIMAGMGGSGKTTTAAAVIEYINMNRNAHILTIEDPIEIVFTGKRAFISQRSLGTDVETFAEGVAGAMRQDPDVIFIGEMRDVNTVRAALGAASTGVLVVSTLNSGSAYAVINRLVTFFNPVERDLVRQQLQDNLRGVICQKLIPKKGGGRVPALEVLFNDIKPISDAIDEGSTIKIRIGMQQTLSHSYLFEHHLYKLLKADTITLETARAAAQQLDTFDQINMGTYKVPRLEH